MTLIGKMLSMALAAIGLTGSLPAYVSGFRERIWDMRGVAQNRVFKYFGRRNGRCINGCSATKFKHCGKHYGVLQ